MGHDRVIFGPYWDHTWPYFTSRAARALKFSSPSHHCLRHMSMKLLFYGIMSVQCLNHTGTIVGLTTHTSKPDKAPKCSSQSQYALRNMGRGCLFFG